MQHHMLLISRHLLKTLPGCTEAAELAAAGASMQALLHKEDRRWSRKMVTSMKQMFSPRLGFVWVYL